MKQTISEPRLDAAIRCYALHRRRVPGSLEADAAELAAGYALSPRRPAESAEELLSSALHDGRRTATRAWIGRQAVDRELAHLTQAGINTAAGRGHTDPDELLRTVMMRELLGLLQQQARTLGRPGPRILAGMLAGESEQETAQAAATSRATVTRTRRALRRCACEAGYGPATTTKGPKTPASPTTTTEISS